jgi:hypothetical protein
LFIVEVVKLKLKKLRKFDSKLSKLRKDRSNQIEGNDKESKKVWKTYELFIEIKS